MTVETDLIASLKTCCPRVFAGSAPVDTLLPYVTWQHIGGASIGYVDNTAADKRRPDVQINTWASSPNAAFVLIQQIETALRANVAQFIATPLSEPVGAYDDADIASGYLQSYSIFGDR